MKQTLTPAFKTEQRKYDAGKPAGTTPFEYGFQLWLLKLRDTRLWLAIGFGAQNLQVFPDQQMIVTFTMWEILPDLTGTEPPPEDFAPLAKTKACPATPQ